MSCYCGSVFGLDNTTCPTCQNRTAGLRQARCPNLIQKDSCGHQLSIDLDSCPICNWKIDKAIFISASFMCPSCRKIIQQPDTKCQNCDGQTPETSQQTDATSDSDYLDPSVESGSDCDSANNYHENADQINLNTLKESGYEIHTLHDPGTSVDLSSHRNSSGDNCHGLQNPIRVVFHALAKKTTIPDGAHVRLRFCCTGNDNLFICHKVSVERLESNKSFVQLTFETTLSKDQVYTSGIKYIYGVQNTKEKTYQDELLHDRCNPRQHRHRILENIQTVIWWHPVFWWKREPGYNVPGKRRPTFRK